MSDQPSDAVLRVSFKKEGIEPARIPISALSEVMAAIQALTVGKSSSLSKEEADDDKFRLLKIRKGSANYWFAGPAQERFAPRLYKTETILRTPAEAGDEDFFLSPLERLSNVARHLDCVIELRQPGRGGEVYFNVAHDSYRSIAGTLLVRGQTEIFGKVVRVGGASRKKCSLRADSQPHLLYCTVESAPVARELGQRLYQDVLAHGNVTWLRGSWRVVDFEITSIQQPKLGSISDAVKAIREAGGKDWDKIEDPMSFLDNPGD